MYYISLGTNTRVSGYYTVDTKKWRVTMTLTEERMDETLKSETATSTVEAFDEKYSTAVTKCHATLMLILEQNGGTLFPKLEEGKEKDAKADSNTDT
jgi:hypothetical protein